MSSNKKKVKWRQQNEAATKRLETDNKIKRQQKD